MRLPFSPKGCFRPHRAFCKFSGVIVFIFLLNMGSKLGSWCMSLLEGNKAFSYRSFLELVGKCRFRKNLNKKNAYFFTSLRSTLEGILQLSIWRMADLRRQGFWVEVLKCRTARDLCRRIWAHTVLNRSWSRTHSHYPFVQLFQPNMGQVRL